MKHMLIDPNSDEIVEGHFGRWFARITPMSYGYYIMICCESNADYPLKKRWKSHGENNPWTARTLLGAKLLGRRKLRQVKRYEKKFLRMLEREEVRIY